MSYRVEVDSLSSARLSSQFGGPQASLRRDPGKGAGQWAIADDLLTDPELAADIDLTGVHYPLEHGSSARPIGPPANRYGPAKTAQRAEKIVTSCQRFRSCDKTEADKSKIVPDANSRNYQ